MIHISPQTDENTYLLERMVLCFVVKHAPAIRYYTKSHAKAYAIRSDMRQCCFWYNATIGAILRCLNNKVLHY